jgi:hypothetical protein
MRELAGLTTHDLAARSRLSERQIRTIESDNPPGTIQGGTVRDLAIALKCEKYDLAFLVEKKPEANDPDVSGSLPRTLDEMATAERDARLAGHQLSGSLETPYGVCELLGAERAIEIRSQYGAFEGERFVVTGIIDKHAPLSSETESILQLQSGIGGAFLIGRLIFYDVIFPVTVLTTASDFTRYLLDMQRAGTPLHLTVRVVVVRPNGDWKGFVGFEPDAVPLPYAFVAEAVFDPPKDPNELSS